MFLGSEHCLDSLSIKPSLLCTRSLDVIALFSAFTWDVSCSPCYRTFVFTVRTEWVPTPKSLVAGTGRYYWLRQTILKSIRLEYLKIPPQEAHSAPVNSWGLFTELRGMSCWMWYLWALATPSRIFHVTFSNSLIAPQVGVTLVLWLYLAQLPRKSVANLLNWLEKLGQHGCAHKILIQLKEILLLVSLDLVCFSSLSTEAKKDVRYPKKH